MVCKCFLKACYVWLQMYPVTKLKIFFRFRLFVQRQTWRVYNLIEPLIQRASLLRVLSNELWFLINFLDNYLLITSWPLKDVIAPFFPSLSAFSLPLCILCNQVPTSITPFITFYRLQTPSLKFFPPSETPSLFISSKCFLANLFSKTALIYCPFYPHFILSCSLDII